MKSRIYVVRSAVKAREAAVIAVRTYKGSRRGRSVILRDAEGKEVARFVYSPDRPLKHGTRVWCETSLMVEVE